MTVFQEQLIARMAEKGWQSIHLCAALADQGLSVSVSSVDRWLDGSTSPRLELVAPVALALRCTPNDLLITEQRKSEESELQQSELTANSQP